LYFAAWTGAMRSFAECALLVSLEWRLLTQLGLALPRFLNETRVFWLVAEQIGYLALRQQALPTRAFAQS
jgi:hypothetical protein